MSRPVQRRNLAAFVTDPSANFDFINSAVVRTDDEKEERDPKVPSVEQWNRKIDFCRAGSSGAAECCFL